ncbi:hypothetical protein ACLM5J_00800 [Nocardioides sp. Bht2]|uniref:hypothetical protein n=1 Tax=Nocardioides sp. Bht2 TaxID=3392297 RepID=UPI0039B5C768
MAPPWLSPGLFLVSGALLAASLVGCSGDDESQPRIATPSSPVSATTLTAGTCWDGARISADDALALVGELDTLETDALSELPAFAEPIDCAQPHGLEVLRVVPLVDELAKTTYLDLVDPTRPGYSALRSKVATECRAADPALTAAAEASPLDLIPTPAFAQGRRITWAPVPYASFKAGTREVLCLFEQDEPGTVRADDFRSAELDPAARVCLDADLVTVACNEPHTREQLLTLIATTAVADGQLPGSSAVNAKGEKYVALRNEAFTLFDAECDAYFRAVAPNAPDGLVAVAEFYPELWGDKNGEFSAVCTVSSPLTVAAAEMLETSTSVVG